MAAEHPVIRDPGELSAPWLEAILGTPGIAGFDAEPIGTGQMSQSHRVTLDYAERASAGPAGVVVKSAASDPTSRATGVGLGIYEREIRFYRELAPRVGGALAKCHAALLDPAEGWFTLVLEDLEPARQGDQITGC